MATLRLGKTCNSTPMGRLGCMVETSKYCVPKDNLILSLGMTVKRHEIYTRPAISSTFNIDNLLPFILLTLFSYTPVGDNLLRREQQSPGVDRSSEGRKRMTRNSHPGITDTVTALEILFAHSLRSYLAFGLAPSPVLQLRRGYHTPFCKLRVRSNLVNVPTRAYTFGDLT